MEPNQGRKRKRSRQSEEQPDERFSSPRYTASSRSPAHHNSQRKRARRRKSRSQDRSVSNPHHRTISNNPKSSSNGTTYRGRAPESTGGGTFFLSLEPGEGRVLVPIIDFQGLETLRKLYIFEDSPVDADGKLLPKSFATDSFNYNYDIWRVWVAASPFCIGSENILNQERTDFENMIDEWSTKIGFRQLLNHTPRSAIVFYLKYCLRKELFTSTEQVALHMGGLGYVSPDEYPSWWSAIPTGPGKREPWISQIAAGSIYDLKRQLLEGATFDIAFEHIPEVLEMHRYRTPRRVQVSAWRQIFESDSASKLRKHLNEEAALEVVNGKDGRLEMLNGAIRERGLSAKEWLMIDIWSGLSELRNQEAHGQDFTHPYDIGEKQSLTVASFLGGVTILKAWLRFVGDSERERTLYELYQLVRDSMVAIRKLHLQWRTRFAIQLEELNTKGLDSHLLAAERLRLSEELIGERYEKERALQRELEEKLEIVADAIRKEEMQKAMAREDARRSHRPLPSHPVPPTAIPQVSGIDFVDTSNLRTAGFEQSQGDDELDTSVESRHIFIGKSGV